MSSKNDVGAAHRLGQDPNLQPRPNTDSRELREEIVVELANHFWEDQRYTANGRFEEVRKEAEEMLDRYTANKQRELLEWVHDNRQKKDFHRQLDVRLDELDGVLKNKKESL